MQIIRTSRAQTLDTSDTSRQEGTARASETEEGPTTEEVQGFFEDEFFAETQETAPPPSPFDLLFTGAAPAPGTEGMSGAPSAEQFGPVNVVTLEEWLMQNPDGRYFIAKFKEKMESILENRFVRRLNETNQSLQREGMAPQEIMALNDLKIKLEQAIVKIEQEIDKAGAKIAELKQLFLQERIEMTDLDGDGTVRDDNGEILYIFGKHPVTGETVILQADGKKLAVNPNLDPNYKPALVDQENLRILERTKGDADATFQLNNVDKWLNGGFADSTFGAQIDVSAPEGFWVEADEAGKPKVENYRLKPKPLELVSREDGTDKMYYGQTPPPAEERDKWVFVKTTGLKITSPMANQEDDLSHLPDDARHVFYTFKDKDENTIMKMRIEGVHTTNSHHSMRVDGTDYIPANAVGIAVNGGLIAEGSHSARFSPIKIDAADFESAGKVLPANLYDRDSVQSFYDKVGVGSEGNFGFTEPPSGVAQVAIGYPTDAETRKQAADDTLIDGFLGPLGISTQWATTYRAQLEENSDDAFLKKMGFLTDQFGVTSDENGNYSLRSMGAYLPPDERGNDFYSSLKTGLFVKDLRGSFTGTSYNDIFVIPEPNEENLKELLPVGAEDIAPDSPAYGTYVKAGEGKNIVVSKGGDLFASGVTYLWREGDSDNHPDRIFVEANNTGKMRDYERGIMKTSGEYDGGHSYYSNRIFMHIGDEEPGEVQINNGNDTAESEAQRANAESDDDLRIEDLPSQNDDWYDVPERAQFTLYDNDTPWGMDPNREPSDPAFIGTKLTDQRTAIEEEVIKHDIMDDLIPEGFEWELPPMVKKEDTDWDAFFDEWEFFMDEEGSGDLNVEASDV